MSFPWNERLQYQVSHPHKNLIKLLFFDTLIFCTLYRRRKNKIFNLECYLISDFREWNFGFLISFSDTFISPISRGFVSSLCIIILLCFLVTRHEHISFLCVLLHRPSYYPVATGGVTWMVGITVMQASPFLSTVVTPPSVIYQPVQCYCCWRRLSHLCEQNALKTGRRE
jgi:hypothetical protein